MSTLLLLVVMWSGVFGVVTGSFTGVVIERRPRGESVVRPRSRCRSCSSPIAWFDNVPVVSWLVLRGRCRRCEAPIPFRYLLLESYFGLLFALSTGIAVSAHPLIALLVLLIGMAPVIVALTIETARLGAGRYGLAREVSEEAAIK